MSSSRSKKSRRNTCTRQTAPITPPAMYIGARLSVVSFTGQRLHEKTRATQGCSGFEISGALAGRKCLSRGLLRVNRAAVLAARVAVQEAYQRPALTTHAAAHIVEN